MSEWVLILTMWRYNGGAAIEHIPFPTRTSCQAAGVAWLKQARGEHAKTAICVERPVRPTGDKP